MSRQTLALALCRVSSIDQLENNSLNRQRDSVLTAAERLGVKIPDDGWWSGSVSSKRGTNLNRRDLKEMLERCKKDKRIKYVIVDEPDRFMRSIDEAAYFEVMFRELGVTVWYASDPELNKGDLPSKLLKFTKYLAAEGSNEERQNKSIAGQTKALLEGRYTFSPKPGYIRGYERGIQEPHPVRGPALQTVLRRLANRLVTPSQALIELNSSKFMVGGHSLYKMDKFRKIATDPFYAGIVEIDRQVKVRNENGLHRPLITKQEHYELLKIMNDKKKNQSGPRKNGNPKYPLSNLVTHDTCNHSAINRFVGLDLDNGKNKAKKYEKYRCRACNMYLTREDLHNQVKEQFSRLQITQEGLDDLMEALDIVWKQREGDAQQEAIRLRHKIKYLRQAIEGKVDAAIDPTNAAIKEEILESIERVKVEVTTVEEELENLSSKAEQDKERFLQFAFSFIENMDEHFLELSQENRLRCKQIIFPAGFHINQNKKVYTPEISPLITLATKKKDARASDNSHLVRVKGL